MLSHRSLISSDLLDEDLVDAFQQGHGPALEILIGRYRRFARSKARSYFLLGGDVEDVEQEGMIGLFKAARDYQPERGSFRAFAELCVTRQLLSAIKGAARQKHQPLNRYVSLSGGATGDGETEVELHLGDPTAADPADAVISGEQVEQLRTSIEGTLSRLEVDVLGRFVEGHSYEQIGADLGRKPKAVDNALQRIKRKLGAQLDQEAALALAA